LLRSLPDAEDAVQEVFLGLLRSRAAFARVQNWRGYLFTALRHAVARLAARPNKEALLARQLPAPGRNAEEGMDPEMFRRLERAWPRFPWSSGRW
jgi:DNA-directed RNA polymerase specialized sigma24 family protein